MVLCELIFIYWDKTWMLYKDTSVLYRLIHLAFKKLFYDCAYILTRINCNFGGKKKDWTQFLFL